MWISDLLLPLVAKVDQIDRPVTELFLEIYFNNLAADYLTSDTALLPWGIGIVVEMHRAFAHVPDGRMTQQRFIEHLIGLSILYVKMSNDVAGTWTNDFLMFFEPPAGLTSLGYVLACWRRPNEKTLPYLLRLEHETLVNLGYHVHVGLEEADNFALFARLVCGNPKRVRIATKILEEVLLSKMPPSPCFDAQITNPLLRMLLQVKLTELQQTSKNNPLLSQQLQTLIGWLGDEQISVSSLFHKWEALTFPKRHELQGQVKWMLVSIQLFRRIDCHRDIQALFHTAFNRRSALRLFKRAHLSADLGKDLCPFIRDNLLDWVGDLMSTVNTLYQFNLGYQLRCYFIRQMEAVQDHDVADQVRPAFLSTAGD